MRPIIPGTICRNCNERPATVKWAGQDPMMGLRGYWTPWCEVCATEAQIRSAEAGVARLPALRKKLAALKTAADAADGGAG